MQLYTYQRICGDVATSTFREMELMQDAKETF